MRRAIIVAATGVIALAPLLVTPVAHADECASLPAEDQPGCRAKLGEPAQIPAYNPNQEYPGITETQCEHLYGKGAWQCQGPPCTASGCPGM